MDQEAPRPVAAVVATIVWGFFLFPGLVGAALSPMFFDAPGSMNDPIAYVNVAIVLSFPALCIISIAASWILWRRQKTRATHSISIAQIAAALLPSIPIVYVVGAMAIETLSVFLSGEPMGLHTTIIKH